MRKFFGSIRSDSRVTVESQALTSNMLGDPAVRVVDVYVSAGHDGEGLPLLVDLVRSHQFLDENRSFGITTLIMTVFDAGGVGAPSGCRH